MYRSLALVLGVVVLFGATSLPAQEAILGQLYGTGVHAYFGQGYQNAYTALSSAIDSGSKDPRAFYFRGLTLLKLGRSDEAKMDFSKAAEMEAADVNNFYNVSRAIERIQGTDRLLVEQYRTNARMLAWQRAEAMRRERYEEIQRRETRVLREQAELAPAAVNGAAAPAAKVETAPPANSDPFAAPAAKSEVPPAPLKEAAPPASSDPFAAPAKVEATPPAATEAAPAKAAPQDAAPAASAMPAEAVEETVEAPPAPEAVANPFATPAPGESAAPAEKKAESTAKTPADDPFAVPPKEGDKKAEKPAEKTGDAQPASSGDDPFK